VLLDFLDNVLLKDLTLEALCSAPALRAGLELALEARAAPDAAILVLGHPEAVVHPALAEVGDEAPAQ